MAIAMSARSLANHRKTLSSGDIDRRSLLLCRSTSGSLATLLPDTRRCRYRDRSKDHRLRRCPCLTPISTFDRLYRFCLFSESAAFFWLLKDFERTFKRYLVHIVCLQRAEICLVHDVWAEAADGRGDGLLGIWMIAQHAWQ